MSLRAFLQVDVFTSRPTYGNALAVVLEGKDLDTATMQRFAQWTNLSETTFVLPPTDPKASYRVRIFTPMAELPFAGHPSVGTAWCLLDAGLVVPDREGRLVQECGAGLLDVRTQGKGAARRVSVTAPRAAIVPLHARTLDALPDTLRGAHIVGAQPVLADVGARWILVEIQGQAAVRNLKPDLNLIAALSRDLRAEGLAVFAWDPSQPRAAEVRAFAPATGVNEDPVTGSANAAIGDWLRSQDRLAGVGQRYVAAQGAALGRDGEIEVAVTREGRISIGGACVALVRGAVDL